MIIIIHQLLQHKKETKCPSSFPIASAARKICQTNPRTCTLAADVCPMNTKNTKNTKNMKNMKSMKNIKKTKIILQNQSIISKMKMKAVDSLLLNVLVIVLIYSPLPSRRHLRVLIRYCLAIPTLAHRGHYNSGWCVLVK